MENRYTIKKLENDRIELVDMGKTNDIFWGIDDIYAIEVSRQQLIELFHKVDMLLKE